MGVNNSPPSILFGPNSNANNLETNIINSAGAILAYNGPKNYINNSSFENQLTSPGWSLGTTGALTNAIPTGSPTFGSGTTSLAISIVTSGQIAGLASLAYTASAATTAGNMLASDAFTIDIEDQASILNFSISYKAQTNPGNANWSGTSSNSFGVALYDVTNSAWIIPVGVFGFIQSTGVGKCTGSFQTSSNGTSYRIVVYNSNATTGAITLYFDDIVVGPSVISSVQGVVDWSGTQTSQAVTANVTDIAFTTSKDSTGAWNGTQYVVPISGDYVMLYGSVVSAAASIQAFKNGSSINTFGAQLTASNWAGGSVLVTNCKAGDTLSFRSNASVTITVGNAGVFMLQASQTSPGSNGVVDWNGTQSSQAVTANVTDIAFTTTKDSSSSWNGTQFVVPIAGDYLFTGAFQSTATSTTSQIYRNGSALNLGNTTGGSNQVTQIAGLITGCKPGDTLSLRSTVSATLSNGSAGIFLLNGGQNSANSTNVNARYFASATTITGSLATIVWTTKDFDSANAMSAGTYTIPTTGKYQVNSAIAITGTFALNNTVIMQIQKNGTAVSQDTNFAAASTTDVNAALSDIISCNAGDTIRIQVSSSATAPSVVSSNILNYFSIARVGN